MKKYIATILVVEDDVALNDAYCIILKNAGGHSVESVFDGKQALELLANRDNDPDIILLDLRMPTLDGIGFLREFKPLEHPECTVIVFSNFDAHKDIDEAYSLGVDRYVLKARAAPKDLLHLVDSVLSERLTPEV